MKMVNPRHRQVGSRRHSHRPASGFTLVELLVVIVILALLIGMLVPAIQGAVRKTREAGCVADINLIAQALASFKAKFNDYPPSRIVLVENGNFSVNNLSGNPTLKALQARSITYLRKFWPRVVINTADAAVTTIPGGWYDFDGDGNNNGASPYMLTGSQCLTFFLGGIPQFSPGAGWAMTGFGKNPANPFQNATVTTNRTAPFMEFQGSRLVIDPTNAVPPPNGFPGYLDNLGSYSDQNEPPLYAYFSSYAGAGYDPDDCNMSEPATDGSQPRIFGAFNTRNAAFGTYIEGSTTICSSPAPNPYTADPPVPTDDSGKVVTTSAKPTIYLNAQSYQIISPGYDRLYGIGGQYTTKYENTTVPFVVTSGGGYKGNTWQTQLANSNVTGQDLPADTRTVENDNLTNLASGRLN